MTAIEARPVRRAILGVALTAALIALVVSLAARDHPSPARAANATLPAAPRATAPPVVAARGESIVAIERLPVPTYGANPDAFVRQRHDYPPDTPERLGPKVGRVLFDLETIVDEVSRAREPGSRIVDVRGEPVEVDEVERARQALQDFFDDATPVVDRALAGQLTLDDAFDTLLARRQELNCDLMVSLGMFEEELYFLWPQTRGVLAPGCANPRPTEQLELPAGHHLRGQAGPDKGPVDG